MIARGELLSVGFTLLTAAAILVFVFFVRSAEAVAFTQMVDCGTTGHVLLAVHTEDQGLKFSNAGGPFSPVVYTKMQQHTIYPCTGEFSVQNPSAQEPLSLYYQSVPFQLVLLDGGSEAWSQKFWMMGAGLVVGAMIATVFIRAVAP